MAVAINVADNDDEIEAATLLAEAATASAEAADGEAAAEAATAAEAGTSSAFSSSSLTTSTSDDEAAVDLRVEYASGVGAEGKGAWDRSPDRRFGGGGWQGGVGRRRERLDASASCRCLPSSSRRREMSSTMRISAVLVRNLQHGGVSIRIDHQMSSESSGKPQIFEIDFQDVTLCNVTLAPKSTSLGS